MYKASDIAQNFVLRGIAESNPVTHMKLQKMIYFAHGLYLSATNNPLIEDEIQAWQYGPVIPNLYKTYSLYGNEPIKDTSMMEMIGFNKDTLPEFDATATDILNGTWKALKNVNAIQLSNWSHRPESAWKRVYEQGVRNKVIPNALIKEDLEEFVNEASSNEAYNATTIE